MERIIFQTFGGNTIWPIWLNWFFSKSLNKIKSFFEVTINYYICWQYFYKAFFVLVPTYNGQVINVQGKVLLPWIEPGSSGIRSNHCVIYLCRYRFVRKCIFLKVVFSKSVPLFSQNSWSIYNQLPRICHILPRICHKLPRICYKLPGICHLLPGVWILVRIG